MRQEQCQQRHAVHTCRPTHTDTHTDTHTWYLFYSMWTSTHQVNRSVESDNLWQVHRENVSTDSVWVQWLSVWRVREWECNISNVVYLYLHIKYVWIGHSGCQGWNSDEVVATMQEIKCTILFCTLKWYHTHTHARTHTHTHLLTSIRPKHSLCDLTIGLGQWVVKYEQSVAYSWQTTH